MPPRISSRRLLPPQVCQCFRTRPQKSPSDARQFHASACHGTRLRRNMWAWLKGPGKAFRDPLSGSTNYLSAYDRQGNLLRARRQQQQQQQDQHEDDEELSEEEIERREIEEGLDSIEREQNARNRAVKRAEREAREGIPKERESDLRPYPLNQHFRSQPVLSEELREEIYRQLVVHGQDIESVASGYGVDMRRVAAVGRLKTIEKKWIADGKQLAKPYADAILSMLPQTQFKPGTNKTIHTHESINDLPVHPRTRPQIFYPASESRQFTRKDAAKVFHHDLLPADKRIPLPVLIDLEKWRLDGFSRDERARKLRDRDVKEKEERAEREQRRAAWEERSTRIVPGRRWDFKFQDYSAERGIKKDGRTVAAAVGARYGMPHDDRKRGLVKIPTSVE